MSNENKSLTAEEILKNIIDNFYKGTPKGMRTDFQVLPDDPKRLIAVEAMKQYAAQQTAEKDERIKELEEELKKLSRSLKYGHKVAYETSKKNADMIVQLEAVKKDRDDMQALCTEVHNEMIDTREERDALKKQLETDFYCVERERNGYICDEGQCDKCAKAERMPDIGQTTGQHVKYVDCPDCIAKGKDPEGMTIDGIHMYCSTCDGSGQKIKVIKSFTVQINIIEDEATEKL